MKLKHYKNRIDTMEQFRIHKQCIDEKRYLGFIGAKYTFDIYMLLHKNFKFIEKEVRHN